MRCTLLKMKFGGHILAAVILYVLTNCLLPVAANAQNSAVSSNDVTPSVKPFDSVIYGHVDTVNTTDGNLTVDIPLMSYPQVGGKLKLGFSLHYEGSPQRLYSNYGSDTCPQFSGMTNACEAGSWFLVEDGNMSAVQAPFPQIMTSDGPEYVNYTPTNATWPIRLLDASGAAHYVGFDGAAYDSVDATGLRFVKGTSPYEPTSYTYGDQGLNGWITTPDGVTVATSATAAGTTQYQAQYCTNTAGAYPDINCESPKRSGPSGNAITFSRTSGWVDTAGRSIPLPVSASVSQCPSGPMPIAYALQWNLPGYNGGTYPVLICYIYSGFYALPQSEVSGMYPGQTSLIQSVVLPGDAVFSFTYAQAEPWQPSQSIYASCVTLSSIKYPTGATVNYTWSYGCRQGNIYSPGGPPTIGTRTENANDGTGPHQWTYSYSTSGTEALTETDPLQNDTVYTLTGSVPESSTGTIQTPLGKWLNSRIDWYQGTGSSRTLLKSKVLNYQSTGYYAQGYGWAEPGACIIDGTTMNNCGMNIVLNNEQTTYPNGQTSEVDYGYDSAPVCLQYQSGSSCAPLTFGRVTSKKEYDFGSGARGALLRTTTYTYEDQVNSAYLSAHILNLLQAVKITDGTGATVSSKTYGYDENNGSPQGTYGNQTSAATWLNTTGGTITTKVVYNANGTPAKTIDAANNTTTIAYDSTGAFPHQITYPATGSVQHIEYFTYDSTTGLKTSFTDQNNQVTQYAYNDPLFRLTSVQEAVGTPAESWTSYAYPSLAQTNIAQDQVSKGDGVIKTTILYDGFGKTLHTQLTSDPVNTINTDIGYDPLCRKTSQSNPYRTGESYGTTSYYYDAIGRPTSQIDSDGSSTQYWTYIGNAVGYQDEKGNAWSRTYDALGRLTKVLEPNGSAQTASMETDYCYDGLDNMTYVMQAGGSAGTFTCANLSPPSGTRVRSFTYDSLSRLLTATNPETGGVTYQYLTNGAFCAGDQSLPCSKTDGRGVTTAYAYDALNRVLAKSFSNDPGCSLWSNYQYDGSSVTNGIGRLASTWTTSASSSSCSGTTPASGYWTKRSILAYDPLGRITSEQQFTPYSSRGGQPYPVQYAYDLAGHLALSTSGAAPASASGPITFTSSFDGSGRLKTLTSSWTNNNLYPATLFAPSSGQATTCQNSITAQYAAFGGLTNALFGSGLALNRTYDARLRTSCEIDTGNAATSPVSASATVTITGTEQNR